MQTILVYTSRHGDRDVYAFSEYEYAEAKAVELTQADFPHHTVNTLEDVRELEMRQNFAVDLYRLNIDSGWPLETL